MSSNGNLALLPLPEEEAVNQPNPPVGRSRYLDDVWNLEDLISDLYTQGYREIDFRRIGKKGLREPFRSYAYWKLGRAKPLTVVSYLYRYLPFVSYCDEAGIDSVAQLTRDDYLGYAQWLKAKGVEPGTGCNDCFVVYDLVRAGQIRGWDVPTDLSFAGIRPTDLWNINKVPKHKTKPIPDDTLSEILRCALECEEDVVSKCLIVILSQTGLRSKEILSLKRGCLEYEGDGMWSIEVEIDKTQKGSPLLHRVFVNGLAADAIKEMEGYVRHELPSHDFEHVFLYMYEGAVRRVNLERIRRTVRLFPFKHGILDEDGSPFHLSPHMFRATFVKDLVRKKVPLAFVMEHYAHVSIEMTAYYLSLSREEIRQVWGSIILEPDSKIAGKRAKEIKGKMAQRFRGKTTEEIGSIVSDLSASMSFNPLPTGICLYDVRRGSCTDGDSCFFFNCPNYVTEARYYPVLRRELDLLEAEMARLEALGREREWQRHYVKAVHLRPLVEELEEQING